MCRGGLCSKIRTLALHGRWRRREENTCPKKKDPHPLKCVSRLVAISHPHLPACFSLLPTTASTFPRTEIGRNAAHVWRGRGAQNCMASRQCGEESTCRTFRKSNVCVAARGRDQSVQNQQDVPMMRGLCEKLRNRESIALCPRSASSWHIKLSSLALDFLPSTPHHCPAMEPKLEEQKTIFVFAKEKETRSCAGFVPPENNGRKKNASEKGRLGITLCKTTCSTNPEPSFHIVVVWTLKPLTSCIDVCARACHLHPTPIASY
jgi:hypothetical protein